MSASGKNLHGGRDAISRPPSFERSAPSIRNACACVSSMDFHLSARDRMAVNGDPALCAAVIEELAGLWAGLQPAGPRLRPDGDPDEARVPADHAIPIIDRADPGREIAVSVIVPAFNVAGHVGKCVESVLSQGLDSIEIILVEDCSDRGGTLGKCEACAMADPRVRLFRTPWNSGLGPVRNLGMGMARGRFATFLDSDDVFAPGFLDGARVEIEKGAWDIVSCGICQLAGGRMTWSRKPRMAVGPERGTLDYLKGVHRHWSACGRLFRMAFLRENGLGFSEDLHEDAPFMIEACMKASRHLYLDVDALIYTADRPGSIMNDPFCGRKRFMSAVRNLVRIHRLIPEIPDSRRSRLGMFHFMSPGSRFWMDFLGYVHCCRTLGLPSPLSPEIMGDLLSIEGFMPEMMRKFAELLEKPAPGAPSGFRPD